MKNENAGVSLPKEIQELVEKHKLPKTNENAKDWGKELAANMAKNLGEASRAGKLPKVD